MLRQRLDRGSDAYVRLLLAAIALLAFALRLWGVTFGWGQLRARPDEDLYIGPAMMLFDAGADSGLYFGFTEGYSLLLHGLLRLQAVLLGWRHGVEVNLGCLFALQPTLVLLPGRWLSVLLGAATLVPCALAARRLVKPAHADVVGATAALLLALNYLHGRDSHFAVPDTALTFALACALAAAVAFAEDGRVRNALGAAVSVALAVAFKWTGLFMMPVLALALAIGTLRFPDRRARRLVFAVACVLVGLAVFLALDPRVLHDSGEAMRGLFSHAARYGEEGLIYQQDPSVDLGRGILFHARSTLPIACGWFGFAMALLGMPLALVRRPVAAALCTLYFACFFVLAVGPTRTLFVRYCMPVMPVLAILGAAGLVEAAERLGRWIPSESMRRLLLTAGIAAAVLPPALRLVQADVRLARADTRTLAAEWLRAHADVGAVVVPLIAYSSVYAVPAEGLTACANALPDALRAHPPTLAPIAFDDWPRWTPAVARGRVGWGAVAERALLDYWNMPGVEPTAGDWVTYGQPLLSCGKPAVVRGLTPPAAGCFAEVARFAPGRPSCEAVYDLFDQFYLPFAGFDGVERPGPEVVVYRNACKRG